MQQPKPKHGLKHDFPVLWETNVSKKELALALLIQMNQVGNTKKALRDLLAFYDRSAAASWTAADVERLRKIRELAAK